MLRTSKCDSSRPQLAPPCYHLASYPSCPSWASWMSTSTLATSHCALYSNGTDTALHFCALLHRTTHFQCTREQLKACRQRESKSRRRRHAQLLLRHSNLEKGVGSELTPTIPLAWSNEHSLPVVSVTHPDHVVGTELYVSGSEDRTTHEQTYRICPGRGSPHSPLSSAT